LLISKASFKKEHISLALLELVGFSNFPIEWMSLSTSKKILYFPLSFILWAIQNKKFSSSITFLQNLQNLFEAGIFGLEYLPVSIAKECALTLIFDNNDLSDLVKLN
jgi:hypothetical protein